MKNIEFLKTAGIVAAGVWSVNAPAQTKNDMKSDQKKQNIIFILADDLGYPEISCNGSDNYKTPNIDKLATQGLRFTNAYAAPLSGPSRAVIMTGRYAFRTGATNQDACSEVFSPSEKMLPTFLKPAGYISSCIGKWGQLPLDPSDFAFDDYLRFYGSGVYMNTPEKTQRYKENGADLVLKDMEYMPDLMNNHLNNFLEKNQKNPFFIYYSLAEVHAVILPTPDSKPNSDIYADNITYMDKLVGQLRAKLDQLKLTDNTIIIFFSDNGTAGGRADQATMGGRRLIGQKGSMQEGGSLEPLIVYWPGVTPVNKVSHDLISSSDFLTTFSEIAGTTLPKDIILDGQSFNAQLHGQKGTPRTSLFVQLANNYWVRNSGWKLNQSGELFDMSKAPFEEILVPVDTKNPVAIEARKTLQAEMDRLNPAAGYHDEGGGDGRHANKAINKAKKAAKKASVENKKSDE